MRRLGDPILQRRPLLPKLKLQIEILDDSEYRERIDM